MAFPDDTSRERDHRPTDPTHSPHAAEGGDHAIPFGEGVYGLGGRRDPDREPRPEDPGAPERDTPDPAHVPPRQGPGPDRHDQPPPPPPPEFDFRSLAAELGFDDHVEGRQCVGFCPICRSADLLRTFATPELRAAWSQFARELARALSAAADRYAGPGEQDPAAERITEIPID